MLKRSIAIFGLLLVGCAAIAASTSQAVVTWTAPTANTDGTPITGTLTYNVYQGLSGALVKVVSNVTGTSTTITTGLTPGTNQCFAVTSVEAGVESDQSPSVCVAIGNVVPGVPTKVIVVVSGTP